MPEIARLYLFVGASVVLLLTPGPAVLYIVARSVNQGRMAGIASVFGVEAANSFHAAAAALGLSAILVSSALAFNVVKYMGAAYLVYLGVRRLFAREEADAENAVEGQSLRRIFTQGFVVNLLNPKTALFFLAFLPQFVNPSRGSVVAQVLFLGLLFVSMATVSDSVYALLASSVRHWLRCNRGLSQAQRWVAGSIYVGLGVTTAFSSK